MNRVTLFCASLTGASGVRLLDFIVGTPETAPSLFGVVAMSVTFAAGFVVVLIAWRDGW